MKPLQNPNDPQFRFRMMRESVAAIRKHGGLFMPLLNLISTYIDGLASGPSGGTKKAYLRYLKTHFPDLCRDLGAETFYSKFRNGSVHEFSIKSGFAIAERDELANEYVGSHRETRTSPELVALNIDRFADDFERHIRDLQRKAQAT